MNKTYELAEELKALLAPACERCEIAGSIRRGKAEPKDIEIVCVPRMGPASPAQADLFGAVPAAVSRSELDDTLTAMYANGTGIWTLDPVLRRNGPKYKRLFYWGSPSVACDLFITTPECWGVIFAIRTGPADLSHNMVIRARRMGMLVQDGQLWRVHRDDTRTLVPTPEEADFFAALRVTMPAPDKRSALA